jgi:uncharacterized protein YjbI with pentapeptide repeats
MQRADLTGADLMGADLRRAVLIGATIQSGRSPFIGAGMALVRK